MVARLFPGGRSNGQCRGHFGWLSGLESLGTRVWRHVVCPADRCERRACALTLRSGDRAALGPALRYTTVHWLTGLRVMRDGGLWRRPRSARFPTVRVFGGVGLLAWPKGRRAGACAPVPQSTRRLMALLSMRKVGSGRSAVPRGTRPPCGMVGLGMSCRDMIAVPPRVPIPAVGVTPEVSRSTRKVGVWHLAGPRGTLPLSRAVRLLRELPLGCATWHFQLSVLRARLKRSRSVLARRGGRQCRAGASWECCAQLFWPVGFLSCWGRDHGSDRAFQLPRSTRDQAPLAMRMVGVWHLAGPRGTRPLSRAVRLLRGLPLGARYAALSAQRASCTSETVAVRPC